MGARGPVSGDLYIADGGMNPRELRYGLHFQGSHSDILFYVTLMSTCLGIERS